MAGSLQAGSVSLTPHGSKVALPTNYITDFNFLDQYLPDTYEKEFERYGNRSVASFLRMVGAEMPTNSDLIKWAEQGRLHVKFEGATANNFTGSGTTQRFDVVVSGSPTSVPVRVGQTLVVSDEAAGSTKTDKVIVTAVSGATITVAPYAATPSITTGSTVTAFVYGSEFRKGEGGMSGSIEAEDNIFENKPIILKDRYDVAGSDMAQIGWVEVTTENGATGYLWYLKSEHETRLRFEDYLETALVEAVPVETASGAAGALSTSAYGSLPAGSSLSQTGGSEGLFHAVENRGNVWSGGNPTTLSDFDSVIQVLDKQGAIEENVLFLNRQFSFDIDDMLAAQNSYGAGGTSYGLFDNDEEMALNLGFSGFRRGYDFYKTDWKYLNDATMRGGVKAGNINGILVPAGSTTVYDQILGKNAQRPFLHVRYRASEAEDRRYKTWITGSAGGAMTSDIDAMEVHFLSERALCVMGANNFVIFKN
tara:strand:+ start:15238 stop:16674 length:1437 start_codon:yes stop_codon:yes gene_type:complete